MRQEHYVDVFKQHLKFVSFSKLYVNFWVELYTVSVSNFNEYT